MALAMTEVLVLDYGCQKRKKNQASTLLEKMMWRSHHNKHFNGKPIGLLGITKTK